MPSKRPLAAEAAPISAPDIQPDIMRHRTPEREILNNFTKKPNNIPKLYLFFSKIQDKNQPKE